MQDFSMDLDILASVLTSLYLVKLILGDWLEKSSDELQELLGAAKRSLQNQQIRRRVA